MKMQRVCLICLCSILAGCSIDTPSTCMDEELRCKNTATGGVMVRCVSDKWVDPQPCANGMLCNDSLTACLQCTAGSTECADGWMQSCNDKGMWENKEQCPNGVSCLPDGSACADAVCENGEISCSDNPDTKAGMIKTCANGTWGEEQACADNASCRTSKECGVCSNDSEKCVEETHAVCKNGEFVEDKCTFGCLDDKVCKPTCKENLDICGTSASCSKDNECIVSRDVCNENCESIEDDAEKEKCLDACSDAAEGPEFCASDEVTAFIKEHLDIINNIVSKDVSYSDHCLNAELLRQLYKNEGHELCRNLTSCSMGSVDSFIACTSQFLTKIPARIIDVDEKYKSLRDISSTILFNGFISGTKVCTPCGENLYCSEAQNCIEGQCIKKTCDEYEAMCTKDGVCADNECMNKMSNGSAGTDPIFCKDEALQAFIENHLAPINTIASGVDQTTTCKAVEELTAMFEQDGKAFCDSVPTCSTGSMASLYKCVSIALQKYDAGVWEWPKQYPNDKLKISASIYFAQLAAGKEFCKPCGENLYCNDIQKCDNGTCVKMKCNEYPQLCGNEGKCSDNNECMPVDEEGNILSNDSPFFCNDSLVKEFLLSNFEPFYNLAVYNSGSEEDEKKQCKALDDLNKLFTDKGPELCGKIKSCSTGSVESFFKCASNFAQNLSLHNIIPPDEYKQYNGEDVSYSMMQALRLISAANGKSGCE